MTKRSCVPISLSHPTQWQCVSTKSGSSLIETASSNPVLLLASARTTGLPPPPFATLFPFDLAAASSRGSTDSSSSIVLETTFEEASSAIESGADGAGSGICRGLPLSLSGSPLGERVEEAEAAAAEVAVEGVEAIVVTGGGASRGK